MPYEARERIQALTELGRGERAAGELDAARSLYEEAVLLCRAERHRALLAHTLRHLGDIHREADRLDAAERCYAESLQIYRTEAPSRPVDLANAIRSMALLREGRAEAEEAAALWAEARSLYDDAGIAAGVSECCAHLEQLRHSAHARIEISPPD